MFVLVFNLQLQFSITVWLAIVQGILVLSSRTSTSLICTLICYINYPITQIHVKFISSCHHQGNHLISALVPYTHTRTRAALQFVNTKERAMVVKMRATCLMKVGKRNLNLFPCRNGRHQEIGYWFYRAQRSSAVATAARTQRFKPRLDEWVSNVELCGDPV